MQKGHRGAKTGHRQERPHGTLPQMIEICHTRMKQLHTCTADPSCVDNSQGRSRLVHDAPPSHGCQRELSRGFDASRSLGAPPRAWGTHATLRVPYGGHGATGAERAGGSMEGRTHGEGVGLAGCPSGPTPQGGMAPGGGRDGRRVGWRRGAPSRRRAPPERHTAAPAPRRAPPRRRRRAAGSGGALPRVVGAAHHRGADTAEHGLGAARALPQAARALLRAPPARRS